MIALVIIIFQVKQTFGLGAFSTDGLINSSLISLNAFLASSIHLNFLDFFYKSYIGMNSLLKFGKNEERK